MVSKPQVLGPPASRGRAETQVLDSPLSGDNFTQVRALRGATGRELRFQKCPGALLPPSLSGRGWGGRFLKGFLSPATV